MSTMSQRQMKQTKVGFHKVDEEKIRKAAKNRGMSMSRFIRELVLSVIELNNQSE